MSATTDNNTDPITIDEHRIVLMHYQLDNGFGETVDSSRGGLPMTYMHNAGALLPGLERELTGRQKGDQFDLAIYPEDGYGYRDDELISQLPRSAFADVGELHVGMRVRDNQSKEKSGQDADNNSAAPTTLFTVLVVGDDEVTVDANHPLAGQVLHFRIAVVDVREPTEQELAEYLGEGAVWSPPWLEN